MPFKKYYLNRTTCAIGLLPQPKMLNHKLIAKLCCLLCASFCWATSYSQIADFTFNTSTGAFCVPASVQFNATAPG